MAVDLYCPPILEDISALCSWKRSARRAWVAMVFCTQRATQPFSRDETALDVKSSMQDMKQLSTRLPKSYSDSRRLAKMVPGFSRARARSDPLLFTYTDKLLHLALLHALLELALLIGVESSESVFRRGSMVSDWVQSDSPEV